MLLSLLLAAYADGHVRKSVLGLDAGPSGALWVHRWCRLIVNVLGIVCTIDGPVPIVNERSLAVVSNHLSYLDILVYSAIMPFVMVAKSEVRSWPLIGWITAQAGTVYVQRADVKGGRTQTHEEVNMAMATAFASGLPVLFFPEGTTTDGESGVLPFRRGLFHAAIEGKAPLKTAAVAYSLDRPDAKTSIAHHVCFWGDMEFGPHLFRCLGVRGLHVHVRFGERVFEGSDRFQLASQTREEVLRKYAQLMELRSSHSHAADLAGNRLGTSRREADDLAAL